ncbi:Protein of unknown function, partial [Gryllus bimaculatus]
HIHESLQQRCHENEVHRVCIGRARTLKRWDEMQIKMRKVMQILSMWRCSVSCPPSLPQPGCRHVGTPWERGASKRRSRRSTQAQPHYPAFLIKFSQLHTY